VTQVRGERDRDDILECLNAYSWALDLKRCALLTEVFAADVHADYGVVQWQGRDQLIADMTWYHDQFAGTQHLIGSHRVRVDGDQATAGSYAHVVLTRRVDGQLLSSSIGARYEDELERTEQGWRISRREVSNMWRTGDPRVQQGLDFTNR
jgi:hypothetical protein